MALLGVGRCLKRLILPDPSPWTRTESQPRSAYDVTTQVVAMLMLDPFE